MPYVVKFDGHDGLDSNQTSHFTMSNDYTTSLLMNLQQRVTHAENAIGFLNAELQRLTNAQGFQTSIPLQAAAPRRIFTTRNSTVPHNNSVSFANRTTDSQVAPSMNLSEILNNDEEVTFGIHTGREVNGNLTTATAVAVFNGNELTITECATIEKMVGMKSAKPGEILFAFMGHLKEAGIIQRTFSALPWRLATVLRNGQRVTLAQLRREKQGLAGPQDSDIQM
jgi:hypothetical protein